MNVSLIFLYRQNSMCIIPVSNFTYIGNHIAELIWHLPILLYFGNK